MHKKWEAQIPFYVAHTLPKPNAEALEKHLATCADCRNVVAEWQAIASAVREEGAQHARHLPPLSARLGDNLHQVSPNHAGMRVQSPRPEGGATQPVPYALPRPPRQERRLTWLSLAAAVVTIALFGAALVAMMNRAGSDETLRVAALATLTADAEQTEAAVAETQEAADAEIGTPTDAPTEVAAEAATAASTPQRTPTTQPRQDLGIMLPTTSAPPDPSATPLPTQPQVNNPPTATPQVETFQTEQQSALLSPVTTNSCAATNIGANDLIVRVAPNDAADLISVLSSGSTLFVVAQDGNGWYQVQVGGAETGWLFAGALSFNGDCSSLPLVPYPSSTPTQTSTQCLLRAADFNAVNMYAGPGSDYAVLNAFGPNDTPVGIARSDNGWYRVSLYIFSNTWIGWTPAYKVTTIGDCATLPQVTSAGYSPEMMPVLLTPTPFMPDTSSQPTPTTPYQSMIGASDYPLATTTDVGAIPPNTRVSISYAYYDGADWMYFVIAENGASGEARGWQLALAS